MTACIKDCWIVKDEWGVSTTGVYVSEAAANAVARARLNNLVKNGQWKQEKPFHEVLASMVEQQTLFDFGVEDGE